MELSLFLSQLFGLALTIFALAAFARPSLIQDVVNDFGRSAMSTLMYGFAGIMGGLAVILNHNIWTADWRVLVTLFGWSALIKGTLYLVAPQMLKDVGSSVYNSQNRTRLVLFGALVLGVYMAAKGFGY